jgi:hypothetical protein
MDRFNGASFCAHYIDRDKIMLIVNPVMGSRCHRHYRNANAQRGFAEPRTSLM